MRSALRRTLRTNPQLSCNSPAKRRSLAKSARCRRATPGALSLWVQRPQGAFSPQNRSAAVSVHRLCTATFSPSSEQGSQLSGMLLSPAPAHHSFTQAPGELLHARRPARRFRDASPEALLPETETAAPQGRLRRARAATSLPRPAVACSSRADHGGRGSAGEPREGAGPESGSDSATVAARDIKYCGGFKRAVRSASGPALCVSAYLTEPG